MEEQLISFGTAKLAKEKGFDTHCRFYYDEEMLNIYENEDFPYNSWNDSLFTPTQSLLQKWLRELHKIHISTTPIPFNQEDFRWVFKIGLMEVSSIPGIARKNSYSILAKENEVYYNSYEEAFEYGLLEALKLIK